MQSRPHLCILKHSNFRLPQYNLITMSTLAPLTTTHTTSIQVEVESSDRSIWVNAVKNQEDGRERTESVTVSDHEYDEAVKASLQDKIQTSHSKAVVPQVSVVVVGVRVRSRNQFNLMMKTKAIQTRLDYTMMDLTRPDPLLLIVRSYNRSCHNHSLFPSLSPTHSP